MLPILVQNQFNRSCASLFWNFQSNICSTWYSIDSRLLWLRRENSALNLPWRHIFSDFDRNELRVAWIRKIIKAIDERRRKTCNSEFSSLKNLFHSVAARVSNLNWHGMKLVFLISYTSKLINFLNINAKAFLNVMPSPRVEINLLPTITS